MNTRSCALLWAGVAALGMLATGAKPAVGAAPAEAPARTVLSVIQARPQHHTWSVDLPCSGVLLAWQEAIISAETNGLRITRLNADVGSWVKRGQVVAELASASAQTDLQRYQAALASANATLRQARSNADRARALKDSGALPEQQIADYLTAEELAEAAVALVQAQVAAQKLTLAQTRIVAVDDGLITARPALLGQVVSTGTELFRLQRQGRVEWRAELDAKQLAAVKPGARASVRLPSGQILAGTVRLVSPSLASDTRRANVFVSLPPGAVPGTPASGHIEAGQHRVTTVPAASLVFRDGHAYVFEIGVANKVLRRRVTPGQQRDGEIEILDGLSGNAPLVAAGGAFLSDGDAVSIVGGAK